MRNTLSALPGRLKTHKGNIALDADHIPVTVFLELFLSFLARFPSPDP